MSTDERGKETGPIVNRFSPETRESLLSHGFFVYELSGRSLAELHREISLEFGQAFIGDQEKQFMAQPSQPTEIAINSQLSILLGSDQTDYFGKLGYVCRFSDMVSQWTNGGAKAIIGRPNQYVEAADLRYLATGEKFLGEFRRENSWFPEVFTVTETVIIRDHDFSPDGTPLCDVLRVVVGAFFSDGYSLVIRHDRGHMQQWGIFAVPLIMPAWYLCRHNLHFLYIRLGLSYSNASSSSSHQAVLQSNYV